MKAVLVAAGAGLQTAHQVALPNVSPLFLRPKPLLRVSQSNETTVYSFIILPKEESTGG